MKIGIVINSSAGSIQGSSYSIQGIKDIFKDLNIKTEILEAGGNISEDKIRCLIYKGVDAIVAAGGDGTVSGVASFITGNKIPLGILPLGTLNHFAKDLNIPLNIEEAAKVISQRKLLKIDVGKVNGKTFINNSSIGIYPKMVKHRDKETEKITFLPPGKTGKWFAMIKAIIKIFIRFPILHVNIISGENKITGKIPFVFIGNNEYGINLFNLGTRSKITGGSLSLYYPLVTGRLSFLKFFLLALLNKLKQEKFFNIEFVKEFRIESKKKILEVSVDGEVIHLSPPLNYSICPSELTVIVP